MTRSNRFSPQLETMEERLTPALLIYSAVETIHVGGRDYTSNNLYVTGDDGADHAVVADHGGGTVTANGKTFGKIDQIKVDLKGGDDTLDYRASFSKRKTSATNLDVHGGAGDDTLNVRWDNSYIATGNLNGDAGNDTINVTVRGMSNLVQVMTDGGAGDDRIGVDDQSNMQGGLLTLVTYGGDGNDAVTQKVEVSGSTGLTLGAGGGNGADQVSQTFAKTGNGQVYKGSLTSSERHDYATFADFVMATYSAPVTEL
jgi:hypothetical protein